ncbi:hypothetical protein ZWY2020_057808 [Hordeum vulgare]|nr:hypothetical protein ZWY2020_057808 [Hordeum vulgare]
MVDGFQKACMSTRLGIPMIYGIDAVHGQNNVYEATIFPHNVGLGTTRDPYLVKRIGEATALEVRATGIQYAFAPCIAVCRDPRWGRCYESYSEDRRIVQSRTELIPGLQGDVPKDFTSGMPFVAGKNKVAACAMHFVGDGGTVDGINENNTIINREGLMNIHMPAYKNAMDKGVSTVMISYSSWNGVKMHANQDLVTGYLKDTLKFKGFVISDWEGIDRITTPAGSDYSYSDHRDLAREAARKSLVLLKNGKTSTDAPLLPLPKKAAKILVAGSHVDNLGYQCGGWTIEWQGDTGRTTVGTTILEAVKAAVDPSMVVVSGAAAVRAEVGGVVRGRRQGGGWRRRV